ncbi:hypothetical protein ACHAWO_011002 [Cyclotella atomus]|jgi:cysteine synthase A|uniref:Tryptophan synthase beta chain-like PALP domain-containing protein n=1 Tax=Cyclotella atomus TaxID=382360 RepID=A0ABD3NBD1_9STRA
MTTPKSTRYSSIALVGASIIMVAAAIKVKKSCIASAHIHLETETDGNLLCWIRRVLSSASASRDDINQTRIVKGGYESLIGNTPLIYLPHLSSLLNNNVKIYVKMENMNPGGTGKDRAARSMILAAESKGELPRPLNDDMNGADDCHVQNESQSQDGTCSKQSIDNSNILPDIQVAIKIALGNTKTHGIVIEGTSGSTGIALASISSSRGHGVIVVMPDDQSSQKREFLERLGCGVVVVKNCSISNPGHYVNVAKQIWEWIEVERKFDGWYWKLLLADKSSGVGNTIANGTPRLIKAAFMNQFENLANLHSHYMSTGPEIYEQLNGEVDAFVMSAGTGGTIVGVGGYFKDQWWLDRKKGSTQQRSPPRIVLVDPPGSSLYNKVKFGVAYASQMSEQKLRRHRYDTLAEGIGLDRITANFGLGCTDITWRCGDKSFRRTIDAVLNENTTKISTNEQVAEESKIIDDAISITDQQAVYVAHYLLRHEGLFIGSSSAMNIAGALITASSMPSGSNVVTVVCDGGQRHTSRFWNQEFITEWGLKWPGRESDRKNSAEDENILKVLGIGERQA